MVWNKALPANNEKIRNLGIVIRPNWEAIEEGDDVGVANMLQMRSVQLDNRTGLADNNDPVTNAGTHYYYSKDDTGGDQEAFMKDSAGNIIQLSNAGKFGYTGVDYEANSVSYDGTITFNENNLVTAWGLLNNSSLTVSPSSGITGVTRVSTGYYEITIAANRTNNANYIVLVSVRSTGNRIVMVDPNTAFTTTVFRIRRITAGGVNENGDIYFMVIGGQ